VERDAGISRPGVHTFHTVCVGSSPEKGNCYAQDERFESGRTVRDQDAFQLVLDDIHAHGNMTVYCHPEWSGTPAREFDRLEGNFAMEIWNSGCAMEHDLDTNAAYWDELLMQGRRIWGVAVDDGHSMHQHCNGWVMARCDNNLDSILGALERGAFYASCGPEIYDFYVKDGKAVLECSPCGSVGFRYGHLPTRLTYGEGVTRAEFDVPDAFAYLRGVVKDAQGRRAWTQPIFLS